MKTRPDPAQLVATVRKMNAANRSFWADLDNRHTGDLETMRWLERHTIATKASRVAAAGKRRVGEATAERVRRAAEAITRAKWPKSRKAMAAMLVAKGIGRSESTLLKILRRLKIPN